MPFDLGCKIYSEPLRHALVSSKILLNVFAILFKILSAHYTVNSLDSHANVAPPLS